MLPGLMITHDTICIHVASVKSWCIVLQLIFYSGVCWVVCLACTYVVLNNGQFFPLHVSATTPEILGPSHQSRTCIVLNRPVDRCERSCLLVFPLLSLHAVSLEFVTRGENGLQMQTPAWKNQRSERNSTEGQVLDGRQVADSGEGPTARRLWACLVK